MHFMSDGMLVSTAMLVDTEASFYSGLQLKRSCRRKTRNDRRLGTEGYFTYCKNSVGPFLNNITSRGHI
jgi:hypothetical protein